MFWKALSEGFHLNPSWIFSKNCTSVKNAFKCDATMTAARFLQRRFSQSQSTSSSTSFEGWYSCSHPTSSSGRPSPALHVMMVGAPDPTFDTTFCVCGWRGTVTPLLEAFAAAGKPIKPSAIPKNLQSVFDWLQ